MVKAGTIRAALALVKVLDDLGCEAAPVAQVRAATWERQPPEVF
jgi:hypothetical protein